MDKAKSFAHRITRGNLKRSQRSDEFQFETGGFRFKRIENGKEKLVYYPLDKIDRVEVSEDDAEPKHSING
jgi:hypothetical protein